MQKRILRYLSLITLPVLLLQTTGMGFFLVAAPANAKAQAEAVQPPPTWPGDNQWIPPTCNDDPQGDEHPSEVDLVASGSDYGAAYFSDANNVYLRERVDGDPGTPGNLHQYAWVLVIQKDTSTTNYEYLVSLRGSGNGENVELWENTVPNGPINFDPLFNDPAETLLMSWSTLTNSRVTAVGSDFYVDWQIPLSELTSRDVNLLTDGLYFATSTDANNYNKDHLDCYNAPQLSLSKQVQKNHAGPWFEDGRTAGIQAAPGDTLTYRIGITNAGGPATNVTIADELGKGDAADGSQNIDPATQYSDWTSVLNLNADGTGQTFTGSWGDGSSDGQPNDTLTLNLANLAGGGVTETATFDAVVRSDLPVGTHLFENLATSGTLSAETDIEAVATPPPVGSLALTKVVDTGGASADAFSFTINPDPNGVGTIHTTNGTYLFNNLPAGDYTVTELPFTDYHVVSNTCTNVHVTAGQQASCAYHNAHDTGTITLEKIVQGGTAQPGDWGFTISGVQGTFHSGDTPTLPTGTYTITESGPSGYTLTAVGGVCSGMIGNAATLTVTTNGGTCSFTNTRNTGSVTVNKMVDADGNGTFEGGNTEANTLGFRWGLDSDTPTRLMGSTYASVPTGAHTINENGIANYHFVGWYPTGSTQYSCANPQGTTLPAGITVAKDQNTSLTLCNARNTAGLTVNKDIDTDGDGDIDIHNTGWTWDLDGGNQNYPMGSTQTVITGSHDVSEDNQGGYHNISWSCWNTQTAAPLGAGIGTDLMVNVPLEGATCLFTNARDTGTITVNKYFDDNGDGQIDQTNPLGWTWDIVLGEQNIPGGETRTLVTGLYTITEDTIPNYSATWVCSNQTSGTGASIPVNIATNGQHIVCNFTNTRDTGSVTVNKQVDTNGDGTFDGGNTEANAIGFRWGLNADPLDNEMGTTQNGVLTGHNDVYENSVNGYHFVGWYASDRYSCAEPQGTTLPVSINVVKDQTSVVTLCNALNTTVLGLEKTGPATVSAGDVISYTLAWSITGNTDATNAVITDVIPANTTYLSADCGTTTPTCTVSYDGGSNTVTWNLGDRPTNSSGTVVLNVRSASPIANGTVVTNIGSFDTDQTVPVTDDAQTTLLSAATLNLQKLGPDTTNPDSSITYSLAWSVGGNSPVTNLILTDTLPTSLTFVTASNGGTHNGVNPGGIVTWNLGNHVPGDSGTVLLTVLTGSNLTNGDVIINPATLVANETLPVNASKTTTITAAPILTISKAVNLPFANPGDEPTYTVTITNIGNDKAVNVTLTDTLPTGFTFVDGGGTTKTFALGTLEKGKSTTVTYRVKIDFSVTADTYRNLATARADNHGPVTAIAPLEVRIPIVAAAVEAPSLSLEKRVDETTANPGDTLTYVLTVSNSGNAAAQDVRISDTLPSDFTYSDTGSAKRVWMIGTLLAGELRTITYQVVVGDSVKAGKHTNTAIATALNLDPVTAKASVDVKVPKVLGALTTTGASPADLAIFLSGLALTVVAGYGLRKLRTLPA